MREIIFNKMWSVYEITFILVQFRRQTGEEQDLGNSKKDVVKILIKNLDKIEFGAKDRNMCFLKFKYALMEYSTDLDFAHCLAFQ